jgi:tRNA threonylcarbamoyl adenosine modification protein YjeE
VNQSRAPFSIDLADESATRALAEDVAAAVRPGDVIALRGSLGVGKTTFARAFIRAVADDSRLEVPSPTFTLVQTYETPRFVVAHFDLYRLSGPDELDEIGLSDSAGDGVVLVEWPERAGGRLPENRLDIVLEMNGTGRRATLMGQGTLIERVNRARVARTFLDRSGWAGASRRHLAGDASARRYGRVLLDGHTAVLMDWPPQGQLRADDPRSAFRARDAGAFLAVDDALRGIGLSAPEIHAADVAAGLLLLEDLGAESISPAEVPAPDRYRAAIEVLATIHGAPRPHVLERAGGPTHALQQLTGPALLAELNLFADVYARHVRGTPLTEAARAELLAIWRHLDAALQRAEQSWILFDVQSPNLFWLGERSGTARVGLIDFQDMFFGPAAYDVASLTQDARVTIPEDMERHLVAHYVALRTNADPGFDADSFNSAYAIAGALRHSKNLGALTYHAITGKPLYLRHLPRTRAYLMRAMSHPVLSDLSLWYEKHLTPEIQAG